jgi:hypothetical protein
MALLQTAHVAGMRHKSRMAALLAGGMSNQSDTIAKAKAVSSRLAPVQDQRWTAASYSAHKSELMLSLW